MKEFANHVRATLTLCTLAVALLIASMASAHAACLYGTSSMVQASDEVRATPTFRSMSLDWATPLASPDLAAHALFRELDADAVGRSLDLVYADGAYRGSVVGLNHGTMYEFALVLDDQVITTIDAETWCEDFPTSTSPLLVDVPSPQTEPFVVSGVHGQPDAYLVVTAFADAVLDGRDVSRNVIIEDSSYIIIRGLTLVNAKRGAILLKNDVHDIVIENNVIQNWGSVDPLSGFALRAEAITTVDGGGTDFTRLVIRDNVIRDPRWSANSWLEIREDKCAPTAARCHPIGAIGIVPKNTGGNSVVTGNAVYSTNGNYFQDGVSGAAGGLNRDSDVYGNTVMSVWDDAVEIEGANRNVRIWGNYVDEAFVAFALAPVTEGPVYLFRNVVFRTRLSDGHASNSGVFMKTEVMGDVGRAFVFHNTTYTEKGEGGVKIGINGSGTPITRVTTRNNVINAAGDFVNSAGDEGPGVDMDWDLYQGAFDGIEPQEFDGIFDVATFAPSWREGFAVKRNTAGHDDGVRIPNFSDDAVGAPDMGAQERDAPLMLFGAGRVTRHPGGGRSMM